MAGLFTSGAESGHPQSEGCTNPGAGGVPTFDTAVKRTGAFSFKATAVNQYMSRTMVTVLDRVYFFRLYYQVPTNPTGLHRFFSVIGPSNPIQLEMVNGTNRIRILDSAAVVVATGTTSLVAGQWYMVEVKLMCPTSGQGYAEVKLDGAVEIAQTSYSTGNSAWTSFRWGVVSGNIGGLAAVYHDDVALNDDQGASQNGYPGPGGVYLLLPVADPGTGTNQANWTKPGGTATGRHTSIDNVPSIYMADSTSAADAEKFLRNPTNAASQLEIDVTDYTTAGVPSGETINVVVPVVGTGSASATDTSGDFGVLSNPTGSQKAMTTFDNAVASTTVTTWPTFFADPVYLPTVTRGTRPRLRLARAAANRSVMTNFMGLLVESGPAGQAETQPISDTFGLTDARSIAHDVNPADSLALTDAEAIARSINRSDTLGLADVATPVEGGGAAPTGFPRQIRVVL